MVAELRLDRIRDLADRQLEGDLVELGNHLAVRELSEIASLGRGGAVAALLRELCERGADVDSGNRQLELQLLDLRDCRRGGSLARGVAGDDVVDDLLRLGHEAGDVKLVVCGPEHLVDDDAVLELLERAVLAERELLEELLERRGRTLHAGDVLEEALLAGLAVVVGDDEAFGLRLRHERVLDQERLRDLVAQVLARELQLLGGDALALRRDDLLHVGVDVAAGQLQPVDLDHHFIAAFVCRSVLLAAACNQCASNQCGAYDV